MQFTPMWRDKKEYSIYGEHPNPAWARRRWFSLDGRWSIAHGGKREEIIVPYPVGSEASGVDFGDSGLFTYSRTFMLDDAPGEDRLFINVGASDYETTVRVNGLKVGHHVGGYSSFRFEITGAVRRGENEIDILVRDSHSPRQVRGKQTFLRKPFLVWYSGYAGIWQPVWIERTGPAYVESAAATAEWEERRILVSANVMALRSGSPDGGARLMVEVESPGGAIVRKEARCEEGDVFRYAIPFDECGLFPWSPEKPDLYRISYRLVAGDRCIDEVESYFGARRIEAREGKLLLNGEPVFLRMALEQGYFPKGGYAPESSMAIEEDIRALKRMGFNGARIHQKIESPRFHYLCDVLGLLTTFEMPSFYWPTHAAFEAYEHEFREVITRDAMHPSSIAWVPFNETWGIWGIYRRGSATRRFVEKMISIVKELDPGRPVIDNSGWEHFNTDIVDFHHYLATAELANSAYRRIATGDKSLLCDFSVRKAFAFYLGNGVAGRTKTIFLDAGSMERAAKNDTPWFLSEYGGFGWYKIDENGTIEEKIERYTYDAVDSGLFCGYCLTQLYDVGAETNGLLTAERKPKVDEEKMRSINSRQMPRK
jgi:beta-galactosidase/beta-glucuronidase